MALSVKVGSFAAATATGNQAVTGVGFQPKVVIFMVNERTADGSATASNFGIGVGISSSDRRAWGHRFTSGGTSGIASNSDTKCIIHQGNAAILRAADLVTLDSDGFTVNWTTADSIAQSVSYIALGGTDVANVKTGQFQLNTGTGNQSVTGLGFQPDSVLFFGNPMTTSAPPQSNITSNYVMIGVGKSASARGVVANANVNLLYNRSYQRTAKVIAKTNASIIEEADLVSLDSDGFTINLSTASAADYVFYLAIKGPQFAIGAETQKTSTGTKATSGCGFQPTTLMLMGYGAVSGTSIVTNTRMSVGAGTSSSARAARWFGTSDATGSASQNLDATAIIKHMTENGASPTTQADADLTSLDADGFTLDWTTADATAREFLYFAIGAAAGGAPALRRYSLTLSGVG